MDDDPLLGDEDEAGSPSMSEKVSAKMPDKPSMATGGVVDEVTTSLAALIVNLTISVAKLVPFTERFFRGLINAGYRGLLKKSDGDVIGHMLVGNEIKHVPLTYDYESQRYENEYGDYWNVASEGDHEYRVAGRVPTVFGSANSNELGSHVQCEVAEAIDLGENRPLYSNPTFEVALDASGGGQAGQAVADGGANIRIDKHGVFDDEIVDLSSEGEGRIISLEKYYETYPSVVDPEEMKMQEWRGRKAEQSRDWAKYAMKMLLIAAAAIVAATVGPPAIDAMLGSGGGGGGGSIIPGMLAGGFL